MRYNFTDLEFRDLYESEKKQFDTDGFIGDEGGDGYYARIVGINSSDYKVSNGHGGQYDENFEVGMVQLNFGCLYQFEGKTKVFVRIKDKETGPKVFYLVKPFVASSCYTENIVVFDNLEEAIDYYTKLVNFGKLLASN